MGRILKSGRNKKIVIGVVVFVILVFTLVLTTTKAKYVGEFIIVLYILFPISPILSKNKKGYKYMKKFFIFCKQMFAFFENIWYYRFRKQKICSER